ncbi:MAG: acetoacetate--CoA ligase [Acidimicrobiales bacterium]
MESEDSASRDSDSRGTDRWPDPLWQPSPEFVAATQMDRFRRRYRPGSQTSDDLWQWSVAEPGPFWRAVWEWSEVIGDPGSIDVEPGQDFQSTRFLPRSRLNLAENLLAARPGAAEPAIIAVAEPDPTGHVDALDRTELSWDELRAQVSAMAAAFRTFGVEPGDRVAAWMPHRTETIVAFLAAASIGAVFTSTSADFGVDGVVDRFGQTAPKILVAADGYRYGGRQFPLLDRLTSIAGALPSVERVLIVANIDREPDIEPVAAAVSADVMRWDAVLADHRGAPARFERLPGDHPIYILYSSGTTGKPKCIVHRSAGVLLKHLCEQRLHSDIGPGDRAFFFTTCGWMMWNWLVGCLGTGATIVLYDGNPAYPSVASLFEMAEREGVTFFGVSAKYIDSVMKTGYRPAERHDLSSIRSISSTGSPLSHEGFAWVYRALKDDVHLASISGGTDLCGCLVLGDPTKPVNAGEIQGKALGLDIDVFDDRGRPAPIGSKGDLVCRNPFPSMPLEFWGDDDGSRYRAAYFERFPGVWAHGDFASWTERGGMVIHGRSDATLNASGVRIGTAEIYRVVEQLPEVAEAIAVAQEWDGDTRIVLFVRPVDGHRLDDDLERTIRSELRTKCSPRHVPAVIAEVADIPRTRSGKIVELAVTETIHGRPVLNLEALANPEALDHFAARAELG